MTITDREQQLLTTIKQAEFKRPTKTTRDVLIRTTLAKALFSSPEAFRSVLNNRKKKIQDSNQLAQLKITEQLLADSRQLTMPDTNKYQELNKVLDKIGKKQRVVIFTESKVTQQALKNKLSCDRNLRASKEDQEFDRQAELVIIHAGLAEDVQQKIVEDFATSNSKIKILIATDVASEGINLHHFCNHLIHYDISWSLITLEQRNGRIDRYGQTKQPHIYYIVGQTDNQQLANFNECYVVDKLTTKLETVKQQLGDAGLAMGLFNSEQEEKQIAKQIEEEHDPYDIFLDDFDKQEIFGTINDKNDQPTEQNCETLLDDEDFFRKSMQLLKIEYQEKDNVFILRNDKLRHPFENFDKKATLQLTCDLGKINDSITQARKTNDSWPELQYWWEINPLWQTVARRVDSQLNGREVRVATLSADVTNSVAYFVLHGSVTNCLGQPQISELQLAYLVDGQIKFLPAYQGLQQLGFAHHDIANRSISIDGITKQLNTALAEIVSCYSSKLQQRGDTLQQTYNQQLYSFQNKIDSWHKKKIAQLSKKYKSRPRTRQEEQKLAEQTHDNYRNYIEKKFKLQSKFPYIKLLAVIIADEMIDGYR